MEVLSLYPDVANLYLKFSLRSISDPAPAITHGVVQLKPKNNLQPHKPPILLSSSSDPTYQALTSTPSAIPNLGNRPANHPSSNLFVALRSLPDRRGFDTTTTSSSASSIIVTSKF